MVKHWFWFILWENFKKYYSSILSLFKMLLLKSGSHTYLINSTMWRFTLDGILQLKQGWGTWTGPPANLAVYTTGHHHHPHHHQLLLHLMSVDSKERLREDSKEEYQYTAPEDFIDLINKLAWLVSSYGSCLISILPGHNHSHFIVVILRA